jgi:signal transduction histidine kinase
MVCVSDTGVALPPQQRDQIFSTVFTSTGISLSINRSIVESHSGRLWLRRLSARRKFFTSFHPPKPGYE